MQICERLACESEVLPVDSHCQDKERTEFDGKVYCSQACAMQDAGLWYWDIESEEWFADYARVTELAHNKLCWIDGYLLAAGETGSIDYDAVKLLREHLTDAMNLLNLEAEYGEPE